MGLPERDEARRRPESWPIERPVDAYVGRLVGSRYKLIELVAQGGFGRIYRAEQLPLGRVVAVKILDPSRLTRAEDPEFAKRFLQEAATCSKLRHAGIVTIFDFGSFEGPQGDTPFMAMEYVEGETLAQALKKNGPFDATRAASVARRIARALREAHKQGVVHRDLKPQNVMLTTIEGHMRVKVLDFGLSKVLRDDVESLTQDGIILGSPPYMAPEYIQQQDADPRADIYSLGVILFEMLAGVPPFQGEDAMATLIAHIREPIPSIASRGGGRQVPIGVESVVRRCLEKDPKSRYQTIDDFLKEMATVAASLERKSERPPPPDITRAANAIGEADAFAVL
ncbi:MAG: serine/threonine protein kinase, partial [Deltaproteobacteria bacterium]|nr:serine/threonine protein kinase [Deltaproteobacteria bacterium]